MAPLLAQRPRTDRSFERLYRRHVSDVYHYALAVLRNPADAEDVTQTAFLNAYNAYRRGERPAAPRNWLIAIAHNVCRQRFRQSARRPQEVALEEDVADALVDDDIPTAQDIRTALGHLAFNQRAALVMRELEGRSYAEIGEILGVSVSAVETLIFRARRALREQLEGSLTCQQAEFALSRQLDGRLPRSERGALRAHLRACPDCASFARSQRAQRAALRSIAAIPLPGSLASFFGGGAAAAGTGLALKAAAVVAAGAAVAGVGYEGVKRLPAENRPVRAAEPDGVPRITPAQAEVVRSTSSGTRALLEQATKRPQRPVARKATAAQKPKPVKRERAAAAKRPKAARAKGRPAAPRGRADTRAIASRAKAPKARRAPASVRAGSQPARPKPKSTPTKPKSTPTKPPKGPSGQSRPAQPAKSEPPPRSKKNDPPLPVPPPTVSVPALPPAPLPPVPETGKK